MARNDGIDRTLARNRDLSANEIKNAQAHNEREKDMYSNPDIVPEETHRNIHFKQPTGSYTEMFDQLKKDGVISTRGLKEDATTYCELLFDVNSAYFYNHGGYEFAKQFYADAYRAAVEIVGGEQYILSATMHADERNRAMSEALGEDVYHYHLHVVYIPVVEKQILWSKRCKDKSLIGTVKDTIMQVSRSKKWESKPALDEDGKPLLSKAGKKIYDTSIRAAVNAGITNLSNYLLYNFDDHPDALYHRLRMNVDLCEELNATIYSFPMKYHPINDKDFFMNRDFIGKHWNRKFIRAVQAVLNSTKGKIGRGVEFFEEAFGRNIDEFNKILWMPETFIIYRRMYDANLRERLAERYTKHSVHDCDLANEWWHKFSSLPKAKQDQAKAIIALNKFEDGDYECDDPAILDVLSYYKITRDIAEAES